jgi:cyclase
LNRAKYVALALCLSAVACGRQASQDSEASTPEIPADQLIRTADPYARGYVDDDFPRVTEVAPGVFSYEQLRSAGDEKFATVSLFVVTSDGVVVADGQGSVEETTRMLQEISVVTPEPVRAVVVASDHGDHTGGNSAFPEETIFYAHPSSASAMEAAARRSDGPQSPLPTELVEDRRIIEMGGKEIHVLFLGRAHTGGDLVVYLPEEKVMFMSEAFLHRVFPAMRSAFPSEWVAMIEAAQAMDVDVFVPGHGFVDHPSILAAELELFRSAVQLVIDEGSRLHEAGNDLAEAQNQARFGDLETWSLRSSQGSRAIQQVYAELEGELPEGGQ